MFDFDAMRRLGAVLTICTVAVSGVMLTGGAMAAPATVQSNLGTPLPPPSERFREGVAAYDKGDFATAFNIWLPLAQQADLAAMRNVALLLREGKGTKRDPVRALWFYEEAGSKGFALAQVNAAFMHLEGDGVPKNLEAAAFWFHAGARAGSLPASPPSKSRRQGRIVLIWMIPHACDTRGAPVRLTKWYRHFA